MNLQHIYQIQVQSWIKMKLTIIEFESKTCQNRLEMNKCIPIKINNSTSFKFSGSIIYWDIVWMNHVVCLGKSTFKRTKKDIYGHIDNCKLCWFMFFHFKTMVIMENCAKWLKWMLVYSNWKSIQSTLGLGFSQGLLKMNNMGVSHWVKTIL